MAIKLSTGMKQAFLKTGSVKKTLEDYVIRFYSGTPPTSADDAATGTELVKLTLASGTWSASTAQEDYLAVTAVGSNGDTITIALGTESHVYTKSAAETTTDAVATAVANLVNGASELCTAVASTSTTESAIIFRSKFAGEGYTINASKTGTITLSTTGNLTPVVANVRGNGLHFEAGAAVSGGILEKESGVWSGSIAQSGVAQWWRITSNSDSGISSTTAPRIQGLCATAGSDINIPTLTFTAGAQFTLDSFSVTFA